ncbi:hypothetical protein CAL7102_05229 [Dulcicalothrix desertica PCC 7102]|nr:hypothetical protein CAL7102_05229 [Dulcicalothrix desertica PCC 7102]
MHVDGRRGKVFLINPIGLQIGLELTTKKINNFKCQDNSTRELYSTKYLNKIYPPLLHEAAKILGTVLLETTR